MKKQNIQEITEQTIKPPQENKIIAKFRSGKVTSTIWEKTININNKEITVYNIEITNSYTTKNQETQKDEWHKTSNYQKEDIQKLLVVTTKTLEFLYLNEE